MISVQRRIYIASRLALIPTALAFLLLAGGVCGQTPDRSLQDLPPPPPGPQARPTPRPSPTPTPTIDDEGDVIRVTSNLVVVPVSVTDPKGQSVTGLKATDFRLEEEGRAQEIAQIGDPEQVPLEIALLLDVSGSVNARFGFEQEAAARFLKQVLKPVDRATIFAIDSRPRLEQARATAEIASAKVMSIGPAKGSTAFYDSVVDAAHYLAQSTPPQHRRVIVVISDGEDTNSDIIKDALTAAPQKQQALHLRAQLEVRREVERADAAFYSINPSGQSLHLNVISQRAQDGMQQLADATGGTSFVPERPEDLDAVFRQIAAELRAQYLVQYYSNNDLPSGRYLRINVRVPAQPQLRVRARQGYYRK